MPKVTKPAQDGYSISVATASASETTSTGADGPDAEFVRFEQLTAKLVHVPKPESDAKLKQS